jgi:hypothetical protein
MIVQKTAKQKKLQKKRNSSTDMYVCVLTSMIEDGHSFFIKS